jgi:hypothetical protein
MMHNHSRGPLLGTNAPADCKPSDESYETMTMSDEGTIAELDTKMVLKRGGLRRCDMIKLLSGSLDAQVWYSAAMPKQLIVLVTVSSHI